MKSLRILFAGCLAAALMFAADATGKWTAQMQGPNGNTMTTTMNLKADGDKIIVGSAIFGGVTLVDTEFEGDGPFLAAIRPKSFAAEPSGGGKSTRFQYVNLAMRSDVF